MKQCIKCGRSKDISAFARMWKDGKVTYRNVCKACYNEQRRVRDGKPRQSLDLVTKYLDACNYIPENIDTFPEDKFKRLFHVEESFDLQAIRKEAAIKLESLGYCNPDHIELEGRTLVIGDTFGKHTTTETFDLILNIINYSGIKQVVLIGHNTDDYNDVSNCIAKFNVPVYFLAIKNELKDIQAFCNQYSDKDLNVVLDYIKVNGVLIRNQEYITPYTKSPIDTLDASMYPRKCIVNCTRHEYFTRPYSFMADMGEPTVDKSFIASPGALSEPHVVRVQYKVMLANGGSMKSTPVNKDSFLKYRKNDLDKGFWEKGCIIVDSPKKETGILDPVVDMVRFKDVKGNLSCVIQKGNKGFLISNGANSKSSDCIKELRPDAIVMADLHVPYHTVTPHEVDYLKSLNPKSFLILGDLLDMRPFNPHDSNARLARTTDLKDTIKVTKDVLKSLSDIAPVTLLWGNHENFANRFFNSYPQLESYIMDCIISDIQKHCNLITKNSDAIRAFNGALVTHGSQRIYGGHGKAIDQLANYVGCPKFGEERPTLLVGHSHSPAIRFNTYVCGCSCSRDQGYNNYNTTNWDEGMLALYNVDGVVFINQLVGDFRNRSTLTCDTVHSL